MTTYIEVNRETKDDFEYNAASTERREEVIGQIRKIVFFCLILGDKRLHILK
jgi:hypothetical protein